MRQIENKTLIKVNNSWPDGETIETKIERIVTEKSPITDGCEIIYTDRKDGVQPEYDIRTDRFEVALDAQTAIQKSAAAKRANYLENRDKKTVSKTESTEATD